MSGAALPISAAVPAPAGANVQMVRLRPPSQPRNRSTWFLLPAVFLLAAGTTFLVSYFRTGSVIASSPRAGALLDTRGATLDLRVETEGAGLRLSWNRNSPLVQAAKAGMLEIDDGVQHRRIALDHYQIVNGSIVYRPLSDDVSFRLNLHTSEGPDLAQGLRVLDVSPRFPPIEAAVLEKSNAPVEPVRTSHRAPTREPSRTIAAPEHRTVQTAAPGEHKAPAPVQVATPAPRISNPAAAQSTPLPYRETALSKLAGTSLQPPSTPTQIVQSAATRPQSNLPAASNPTLTKPNPVAAKSAASSIPPKSVPVAAPVPVPAYVPPRPLKWVEPNQHLLGGSNPSAPVDITVKVKIDETGRVTAAHALIVGAKHDKKLMAAAADAVRQWVFEPAKSHGTNVPSEETIVVHLGPEAQ